MPRPGLTTTPLPRDRPRIAGLSKAGCGLVYDTGNGYLMGLTEIDSGYEGITAGWGGGGSRSPREMTTTTTMMIV